MPRSLFGRAMIILAVPVIVIQVVVAVYFAERLFRDVSVEMSSNIALEVNYLASLAKDAPDRSAAISEMKKAARPLQIFVEHKTRKAGNDTQKRKLDLSATYVLRTLKYRINNILYVDLQSNNTLVQLAVQTDKGPIKFAFSRARTSASNPHQLLIAMLLTALIFTGISILFLNNQIKPIKKLSDAAEAFGRGWSIPFNPRGAREVRSAGHSFLAMRARIIRQIEQRTMMLSGVSHDLRTPLTRMKLSLGLLDPSEEVEYLKRDVDEMERMLTEFLEFARGDAGEITETVSVHDLITRIARNFKRAGHDIDLVQSDVSGADDTLKCREQAVQRAIENLLGNAVRYAKSARLTLEINPNNIVFTVEDDGPGIPKDKREVALEPFCRLDSARNQNKGVGSGLGLAIATDVARSHGGKLRLLESDDMGGLKAILTFPR